MLASTLRRAATAAASRSNATINIAQRTMAMGPAQGGEISDELLAKLGSLSTQALVDGLWVMGWPSGKYIIYFILRNDKISTTTIYLYREYTHQYFRIAAVQLKLMALDHWTLRTSVSEEPLL